MSSRMSSRATTRCLKRAQTDDRARRRQIGMSVTAAQQPVDGGTIGMRGLDGLRQHGWGIDIPTRVDDDFVADRFERDHEVRLRSTIPHCGQQTHDHRVGQRRGICQHGHDVVPRLHGHAHRPQIGVMLHQPARRFHGVGHQHRFGQRVVPTRQLPQCLQQRLELIGVLLQSPHESFVGGAAASEHTGHRPDRRQTIAHGVRQSPQQIVVNDEPARDTRRLAGVPVFPCVGHR